MELCWKRIKYYKLDKYVGKTVAGIEITESGMLAGAHLKGVGGLKDFLTNANDNNDAYGTKISEYIRTFGHYQTPYDINPKKDPYNQQFESYLRRGIPPTLTPRNQPKYYIWHTQEDEKVRSAHAANDGKLFSWDDPPPTGHPGQDYNCRCWAESILP